MKEKNLKNLFFVLIIFSIIIILLSQSALAAAGDGTRFNTKTIKFYLNSSQGSLVGSSTTTVWNNFTTNLSILDTSITILNAYLIVSGTLGAATGAAGTITVYLNETSLGAFSQTESGEVSGFEFLANASRGASGSDFYSLGAAPQYNKISIGCKLVCNGMSVRGVITYKYDPPADDSKEILPQTKNEEKISPAAQKEKNLFENISSNFSRLINYLMKIFGG